MRFLRASGYVVRTYATATAFLETVPMRTPGCVVLDLRLPGVSGLELQRALEQLEDPLPVVFLSGQGDVPESVEAMKGGAVDFLMKTADGAQLLDAVSRALHRDADERRRRVRLRELHARHATFSPRERRCCSI